jgi:hypothetical protein
MHTPTVKIGNNVISGGTPSMSINNPSVMGTPSMGGQMDIQKLLSQLQNDTTNNNTPDLTQLLNQLNSFQQNPTSPLNNTYHPSFLQGLNMQSFANQSANDMTPLLNSLNSINLNGSTFNNGLNSMNLNNINAFNNMNGIGTLNGLNNIGLAGNFNNLMSSPIMKPLTKKQERENLSKDEMKKLFKAIDKKAMPLVHEHSFSTSTPRSNDGSVHSSPNSNAAVNEIIRTSPIHSPQQQYINNQNHNFTNMQPLQQQHNNNNDNLPMAPLGDGSKEDNQTPIVNRRKTYSKSKQMSVFHYTLRHARQYSKCEWNQMSLEWNFKHLEEKRKIDLKNGNAKPLSDYINDSMTQAEKDQIKKDKDEKIEVIKNADIDPVETKEWLESLSAVLEKDGKNRAQYLIKQLIDYSYKEGSDLVLSRNTPYTNTIAPEDEKKSPGDQNLERKIRALIRWNAAAMVVRVNKKNSELGGHIGTFASAATLYDIGMNHFWRAKNNKFGGDLIYFQGHSAPGMYARAFLEGRITPKQLDNFRQEVKPGGLSSYPHPWLMPKFWQFPTVSMGLGPIMSIYQARMRIGR